MNRNNTLYRVSREQSEVRFDETAALGILQHLDKDALQQLNDNEDKLKDYVNDLSQVKSMEGDKEMLIASNKSLAEYNLSKRPKLNQGREMLALEYERLARLKEEYDSLAAQIASASQTQSLDDAHAVLQAETSQLEQDTEELSDMFIGGNVDCDTFLEQYMEQRTRYNRMRIKSDKLGEMIRQNVNQTTWGGGSNASSQIPQRAPSSSSMSSQNSGAYLPYPMYGQPYMPSVSN